MSSVDARSQADLPPSPSATLLQAAEAIERLVTVDIGGRGVVAELYSAARAQMTHPLALEVALALGVSLKDRQAVFVATGWPDRVCVDGSVAESDGPPGAAALARATHRAFGVVPFVLTEPPLVDALREVLTAAGLRVLPPDAALRARNSLAPLHAAVVLPFPTSEQEARAEAGRLLDTYAPGAVVVIEKGGPNSEGVVRSCRGENVSQGHARVDQLIIEARRRGLFTAGIGDGGNEIGMELIRRQAEQVLSEDLGTMVAGGCVPQVATDRLQVAAISNWGAYATSACLALLCGRRDVFHDVETERRMLESCVRAHLIDGATGYVEGSVDRVPQSGHLALVELLALVVENALSREGHAQLSAGLD